MPIDHESGTSEGRLGESSARQSRTNARDIPRLLPEPLELQQLRSESVYALIASSRSEGVLRIVRDDVNTGREAGDRLVLTLSGPSSAPVRFVVECLPTVGECTPNQFHVRWVLISAAEKRSYLADILTRYLNLNVTLSSERDALPSGRVLMYDAEKRRIRALHLKGGRKTAKPAAESGQKPSVPSKALDKSPPASNGQRALEWLMFERPRATGCFEKDGVTHDMECCWVGFSRCRFEAAGTVSPNIGELLRVGVPTEPLLRGLVWLDGRVCLSSLDASRQTSVVEVEWLQEPADMPTGYRSLVAFCRMTTLKRLGESEPRFAS